jgi:hypothetical protein
MSHNNLPLYNGEKYPKWHWFMSEKFWDSLDITDKSKQMAHFWWILKKEI